MSVSIYGVLGWPVGHSASPAMMNAAFRQLGIDGVYIPFAVPPERLEGALAGLVALGASGVNVTIPHKRAVWERVEEHTEAAALVGAVNTVRIDSANGRICGHNTDVGGWWRSIAEAVHRTFAASAPPRGLRIALLGAGGAARAVVAAAALHLPDARVRIIARNRERAQALAAAFAGRVQADCAAWDDRHRWIREADVVVNTTPVGMWPRDAESPVDDAGCFRPGQVVQDIVYRPLETLMMRQARQQGATVVDGLSMLVHQGALALEYWLGVEPPVSVMHEAALSFLTAGPSPAGG
ncbi:MAG: shikimate dehydrogenase [Alicyclobacillaceae bacterium]|nr:shikimate dehydrogenase [Alicyclobacillaceae bacterium]